MILHCERNISRERERENKRENKRECVFDALGSISNETCLYKTFSFIKKKSTLLYTLNSSPFLPLKMAAEITTKRIRERRRRRTRKREREKKKNNDRESPEI